MLSGSAGTNSYTRDGIGRLTQNSRDVAGSSADITLGYSYNPASQINTDCATMTCRVW